MHVTVTATAPGLSPKTWYGMPAYTNADGKIVVFFQDAGKFSYRYSTLGFQDAANLDDGGMWPVSYALHEWSPVVEKATCLMDVRLGPGQAWVEVSGGSLSHRLPAAGWRGSLMACAPPGTVTR